MNISRRSLKSHRDPSKVRRVLNFATLRCSILLTSHIMLTAFGATPTAGVQCSSFGGLALRSCGDLRTQAWLWLIAITQDIQVIETCRVRFAPPKSGSETRSNKIKHDKTLRIRIQSATFRHRLRPAWSRQHATTHLARRPFAILQAATQVMAKAQSAT